MRKYENILDAGELFPAGRNTVNIQAKVAIDKAKHPERYCPEPRCLWKTAKLNHETQLHEGGGRCPRHGGPVVEPRYLRTGRRRGGAQ